MSAVPTRVVLVKPGDVLILGNVNLDPDATEAFIASMNMLRDTLGLAHVVVCEDDVSIAAETPAHTIVKPLPDIVGPERAQEIEAWMAREAGDGSADYQP